MFPEALCKELGIQQCSVAALYSGCRLKFLSNEVDAASIFICYPHIFDIRLVYLAAQVERVRLGILAKVSICCEVSLKRPPLTRLFIAHLARTRRINCVAICAGNAGCSS